MIEHSGDKDIEESSGTVKLNPQQMQVHKGLKNIGEEIAAFYLDGLRILQERGLETKSYLLAHIAREIEGGLRDILVLHEKAEEHRCKKCNQIILDNQRRHIKDICLALDLKEDDPLVARWHRVAKQFHRLAHRSGAWKEPRQPAEIQELWHEFEKVLFQLVGTYFHVLDRVDRILRYDRPSEQILNSLSNLLRAEARYSYFFRNLQSTKWLRPLKEKGFFDPQKNPSPREVPDQPGYYTIPHWPVLDYLENVTKQNYEAPSEEATGLLVEIINLFLGYKDKSGRRIDNDRSDWMILKMISKLPPDRIGGIHVEFVRDALNSKWKTTLAASEIGKTLLPTLLKEKRKDLALKLIEIMFDLKQNNGENKECESIMDEYWLSKALKENMSDITDLCGVTVAKIALNRIERLLEIDDAHFGYMWIPTIEDHPQNTHADKYESLLVTFVRDIFERVKTIEVRGRVEELLKKEHAILRRLAVHTINRHFSGLGDIFWGWVGNPLEETELKHEVYELLKSNCSSFTEEQIDVVLNWIESKDYHLSDEVKHDREKRDKVLAYRKKEWLFSLLDSNSRKVADEYEKYDKINPIELDHPGLPCWTETAWGDTSPIEAEELCRETNAEIAEYLNAFVEERGWRKPSKEGLSNTLRNCVKSEPAKFCKDLNPFLNVDRIYQKSLLWGIHDAWREKKTFDWQSLFSFMCAIIADESLWREKYGPNQYNYREWIASQIAELINDGTRDDNHAFDPELLPEAEKILLILVKRIKADQPEMSDLITWVLNSTKGKIFAAMVNYSLRHARLYSKDRKDRWARSIKKEFEKRLERRYDPSLDYSVILGRYITNLWYLDTDWVVNNINQIFPKAQELHWKAAINGYLFYARPVYKEIYDILRDNEHYSAAIVAVFDDESVKKQLVQHICVGYIEGWEDLKDANSLISLLFASHDHQLVSEIVSFFWRIRGRDIDKKKIKPLWGKIFKIASERLEDITFRDIISDLSKWLSTVDKIDDEIFHWLSLSARYVDLNHNTAFFIKSLLDKVKKQPNQVAELYLEMLSSGIYPDYDENDIKQLVQSLYEENQREIADRICNLYGEKGFNFLRDLFEQSQGSSNS